MFKIGEFSKLVRVSARMLRYYEKCGRLVPAETGRFTGYRLYSAALKKKGLVICATISDEQDKLKKTAAMSGRLNYKCLLKKHRGIHNETIRGWGITPCPHFIKKDNQVFFLST